MKLLGVNGVDPTYENIKSGLYSLQTAYYAVIRKDEGIFLYIIAPVVIAMQIKQKTITKITLDLIVLNIARLL